MSFTLWLIVVLLLLVVGVVVIWITNKPSNTAISASPKMAQMGYGKERWERELSLWNGVLRRLEIQAKYQLPISERLQQEIDQAKSKIAEAERHLDESDIDLYLG
jgi:hypothetical protein